MRNNAMHRCCWIAIMFVPAACAVPCFDPEPVVEQLRARNGEAAARVLDESAAACNGDADWNYLRARSRWLTQDASGAQASLERALALREPDLEYQRFAANLFAKLGDADRARHHVDRMLQLQGAPATRADLFLAIILAQNGRTRTALTLINELLARSPQSLEALYYRGLFEQSLGEATAAMQAFEVVLKQKPDHRDASRQLAAIHIESGNAQEALGLLRMSSEGDRTAEASFLLSRAHLQLGELQEALQSGDNAVKLNPEEPRYRRQLGVVLLRMKQVEQGRRSIQEAERLERGSR